MNCRFNAHADDNDARKRWNRVINGSLPKLLFGACTLALGLALPLHAQEYPARLIKIVVPYPPGAGTDTLGRVVADKLQKKLGQPVIVENRGGAGGNIGAELVYKAAPDGYTLLFTAPGPLVTNKSLYPNLPFDPDAFAPVTVVATSPSTLVVHSKTNLQNLQQLIAYAKANPDQLNYGSGGNASTPHLAAEMFKLMSKTKIVHIPYAGSGPALTATLGGTVHMAFLDLGSVLPHVRTGALRAIAVGSEKRKAALPDIPAISEVLPGFVSMTWFAVVAPPQTPAQITTKLSAAIADGIKEPDVAKRLLQMSADPIGSSPSEMALFMKQETERWGNVIRGAGIKME